MVSSFQLRKEHETFIAYHPRVTKNLKLQTKK